MLACLFCFFLLVIVLVFMCSIMPWWLVLLMFSVIFIYDFFLVPDSVLYVFDTKRHKPKKKLKKVKSKGKANDVKVGAKTLLAGAALAHQMRKHHEHDDAKDNTDEGLDVWDDDLDGIYDYDEYDDYDDYDAEMAAYEEEQAAYDDFIASMDMDNE